MRIEKRSMNWVPKLSAYEAAQQRAEKRHEMAREYMNDAQNTAAAFSNVRANEISSITQMSTYAVRSRVAKLA